jgi:hypothetical protein
MNCGGGGLELKKAKYEKIKILTICYESNGGIHTHTHTQNVDNPTQTKAFPSRLAESDLEWW